MLAFRFALLGAITLSAWPLVLSSAADEVQRRVNLYNWLDYIDPTVLRQFTAETGITVYYDAMDSNDTLQVKLLGGHSGYDVVVPTGYFLPRFIKAGVLQELDKTKLSNLGNEWSEIATRLAIYDPGNRHAVNYTWGTTGIGFDFSKTQAIYGSGAAIDSWASVFEPDKISKFANCGVMMLDSSDDIMPAALNYLGLDPSSDESAELERAAELVARIRPSVRKFHSSAYINALASGEICLVVGWSGDIKQAEHRAAEAGRGADIRYIIPKEGAQIWFDNFAIPRDAPHPNEAYALIDFLLRPEVAARNSEFVFYANGNLASQKFLTSAILNDRSIYPDEAMLERLYTVRARSTTTERIMNRLWTLIKVGR
jgi:putrescine transport system substrate-binding protein